MMSIHGIASFDLGCNMFVDKFVSPAWCLERLVMKHITSIILASFNQHQFAYRENRLTKDGIAIVLHTALEYLEHKYTYVRMLFFYHSSDFNKLNPAQQTQYQITGSGT